MAWYGYTFLDKANSYSIAVLYLVARIEAAPSLDRNGDFHADSSKSW